MKPLTFRSVNSLKAWLRDTDAGREILADIRREIAEDARGSERCLILLYGDGWVEAYANGSVDVCLLLVPDGATDEVIEALLPRVFVDLYQPVPRKFSKCERVTVADLIERANFLECINECFEKPTILNGRTLGVVS